MSNILAVITARGGSKGVPRKNIKRLAGKPLIYYTINAAQKSKLITECIVSTDDSEIAKISSELGANVPFLRPGELAQDATPTLPVIQHSVQFLEKEKVVKYDYIVILQPTSPFRLPEDIDNTIEKLITSGADSAVSLVEIEPRNHPIKAKQLDSQERVLPFCMEEPEGIRRQDIPKAYKRSSAVYVMKRDLVMNHSKLFGDHIVGHIVPKERYIDIDSELDWMLAEQMMKKMKI